MRQSLHKYASLHAVCASERLCRKSLYLVLFFSAILETDPRNLYDWQISLSTQIFGDAKKFAYILHRSDHTEIIPLR